MPLTEEQQAKVAHYMASLEGEVDYQMLHRLGYEITERARQLAAVEASLREEERIKALRKLPRKTPLLITRGRLVGVEAKVDHHARKYVTVRLDKPVEGNHYWRVPYAWVTDQITEEERTRATHAKLLSKMLGGE